MKESITGEPEIGLELDYSDKEVRKQRLYKVPRDLLPQDLYLSLEPTTVEKEPKHSLKSRSLFWLTIFCFGYFLGKSL